MTNPDPNREIYDASYFSGLPVDSARIKQIIQRINFSPDDSVCEFGTGLGHVLFAIQDRIAYGLGVDFSSYAVEEAKKYAAAHKINHIDFSCTDIVDLPSDEMYKHRFDKILMMDVTEHIEDELLADFLASALTLLKPGGHVIIHTPNAEYFLEIIKNKGIFMKQLPGHIAVRSLAHYKKLLETADFALEATSYLPHYRLPMRLVDAALMHLPLLGRLFRSRLLLVATTP